MFPKTSMSPSIHALAMAAAVLLAAPNAVAQQVRGAAGVLLATMGDDAGIVLGQPCAVVEQTENVTPLADGTSLTRRTELRKWRDSQGRFRQEHAVIDEGQEPVFRSATIIDPVSNTLIQLNLIRKTATVFHLPDHALKPWTEQFGLLARIGVKVKFEKIEGKTIAGVYADGIRMTRVRPPGTIGNDQPVVSVTERWTAPDLKILLASSMNDPRELRTTTVTQLDRSDPDPALFQIPPDFTVRDVPQQPAQ